MRSRLAHVAFGAAIGAWIFLALTVLFPPDEPVADQLSPPVFRATLPCPNCAETIRVGLSVDSEAAR